MNYAPSPRYLRPGPMAQPRPNRLFAAGGMGPAYLTIFSIFLAIIVQGRLTDLLGGAADPLRIGAIVLVVSLNMIGSAICLVRGMVLQSILGFIGLGWIFFYTTVFSINSGIPFTFSAGGEYFGYSFLALFALTLRDRSFEKLIQWLYVLSVGYAVVYILASFAVQLGFIDVGAATRAVVTADDAGRGNRLVVATMPFVFGTMMTIVRLTRSFSLIHALILVLFIGGWFLTSSRTIMVALLAVILAYVVIRRSHLVATGTLVAFLLGLLGSMLLVFYPDYNPYYLATDISGLIRVMSVNIVSDQISEFWLAGGGIAFGVEGYYPITGSRYFYPGDIGLVGMLFAYGVIGLVAYCSLVIIGCRAERYADARGYPPLLGKSLALTMCVFALYSLQSPQIDSGSSASILAVACAALLLDRRAAPKSTPHRLA